MRVILGEAWEMKACGRESRQNLGKMKKKGREWKDGDSGKERGEGRS